MITIYTVSSLRDYSGGEVYFGVDGLFRTREEAERYIEADLQEVLETYDGADINRVSDELSDCKVVEIGDHVFRWLIDGFLLAPEELTEAKS